MTTIYDVQLPELSDEVILAIDPDTGSEALRFCFNWSGKSVKVRYPRWGHWDRYCTEVRSLLRVFASSVDQIEIPDYEGKLERFEHWAVYAGELISNRALARNVERIFFEYLLPTVDGVPDDEIRQWFMDNAPVDAVLRLFIALLEPMNIIKKNARSALARMFQELTEVSSQSTSGSNSAGLKQILQPKAPSRYKLL